MKKFGLLTAGLALSALTYSQTLTFQGGTSISNLNWEQNGTSMDLYGQKLIGYSFFVGLDYFDQKYMNLSSNIGMIRKGGKDEVTFYDEFGTPLKTSTEKASLDYVSFNTTLDFKYSFEDGVTPFISIGPKIEYLVNQSSHFDEVEKFGEINPYAIGLILGAGVKYDISAFQLGLRANYFYDKTAVATWKDPNSGSNGEATMNAMSINVSLGYKL